VIAWCIQNECRKTVFHCSTWYGWFRVEESKQGQGNYGLRVLGEYCREKGLNSVEYKSHRSSPYTEHHIEAVEDDHTSSRRHKKNKKKE